MISDHGRHYYESLDITDPTPYEEEGPECFEGAECRICGDGFSPGEIVLILNPRSGDDSYVHASHLAKYFKTSPIREKVLDFLDDLGVSSEYVIAK